MSRTLERFSTMRVLVVDDNAQNVALVRAVLQMQGLHRVSGTTDPREVASLLPVLSPDLVILDLRMPGLDGHEVLSQVVSYAGAEYLPVLICTADSSTDARNRALSEGARDFITKPLDLDELTLRVANLLETRLLYSTLRADINLNQERREDDDAIRHRVTHVLKEQRIEMALQRVVAVETMVPVGYEALARFEEPHERGPAGWFEDAFTVGMGVELERLAVDKAMACFDELPPDQFLAVNMSPSSVLDLKDRPLPAQSMCSRLVIELTEHVPVEDYGAVHRALAGLRERGARLAADDVGSGYAGFRHLIALEPDIIKLDMSMVSGIHQSRSQRALASALVAFAADMSATVIAEGIENSEDLLTVADIGVPWAQGYHLGRPEMAATS